MTNVALLLLIVAIGLSAIAQIFTDPRITRAFVWKSLVALAVYAVHVAVAILVMVYLLPWGPDAALGVTIAMLGWIGLGTLGLIRFSPRLQEPPAILMRVGIADAICVIVIAAGLASAMGLF
jgi:hypothetical protein